MILQYKYLRLFFFLSAKLRRACIKRPDCVSCRNFNYLTPSVQDGDECHFVSSFVILQLPVWNFYYSLRTTFYLCSLFLFLVRCLRPKTNLFLRLLWKCRPKRRELPVERCAAVGISVSQLCRWWQWRCRVGPCLPKPLVRPNYHLRRCHGMQSCAHLFLYRLPIWHTGLISTSLTWLNPFSDFQVTGMWHLLG